MSRPAGPRFHAAASVPLATLCLAGCYAFGDIDVNEGAGGSEPQGTSSGATSTSSSVTTSSSEATSTSTNTGAGGDTGAGGHGGANGSGAGGSGAGGCGTLCGDHCVDLESDPDHCGDCDHDCLGGECLAGACQPVVLADAPDANRLALTTDFLAYTTTTGQVCRVGLVEGDEPECWSVAAGNLSPTTHKSLVYWTNEDAGTVNQLDEDGNVAQIASGQVGPLGITTLDSDVYWVAPDGLHRYSEANGAVLLAPQERSFRRVATDGITVAWKGFEGWVVILDQISPLVTRMAFDADFEGGGGIRLRDGSIYTHGNVVRCNQQLPSRSTIFRLRADDLTDVDTLAVVDGELINLDVDAEHVYFTARASLEGGQPCDGVGAEIIGRVSIDGGSVTVLTDDVVQPLDIVVDDVAIYWTELGLVKRLAK